MSLRYCWNQYNYSVDWSEREVGETNSSSRDYNGTVPVNSTRDRYFMVMSSYSIENGYYVPGNSASTKVMSFTEMDEVGESSSTDDITASDYPYCVISNDNQFQNITTLYWAGNRGGGYCWCIKNTRGYKLYVSPNNYADDDDRSSKVLIYYNEIDRNEEIGNLIGQVIGSTESQYPANGVSGSYWYVYQGSDSIDPVAVNLSQSSGLYVGLPITISVDPSTSKVYGGSVSYQYQVQLNNDGQWVTLGTTTETSYPYTIPIGVTNLQFRVLASDDLGFTSTDYVNSASVSVVAFKPGTQQVLHRKNASGDYDVIWLETDSDVVIRPDGTTLKAALADIESRLSGLGV